MSTPPDQPASPTPPAENTTPSHLQAAEEPLRRPKPPLWKRLGGEGLAASVLIHLLLIILAAIWVVSTITDQAKKDPNTFATGAGGGNNGDRAKEFRTRAQPKNVKALAKLPTRITSKNSNAKIAVSAPPPTAISTLSTGAMAGGSSKGFGGGTGGGIGSGTGVGRGNGKNFVSLFGARGGPGAGGLIGNLYDLKQTSGRSPTKMAGKEGIPLYRETIRDFLEGGWNVSTFSKFYKAPDTLISGQLYVPSMEADGAPKAYGVADKMKPSRWIAHYKCFVEVPSSMPFRFVGSGDDWLIVRWNRKIALDDGYETFTVGKDGFYKDFGQKAGAEFKVDRKPGSLHRLKAGPWITATKGEKVPIEVLMGETPGGVFDVYLTIEVAKSDVRTNNTFVGEGKLKLFRCNSDPLPKEILAGKRGLNIDLQAQGWIFKASRTAEGPAR